MKKIVNYLELLTSVLFIVTYVELLLIVGSEYIDIIQPVYFVTPYFTYVFILYFLIMAIKSFVTDPDSRKFPIIFLLEIVVILFLPYDLATIFFIPPYLFYQHQTKMRDSLSFIVVGQFLRHLLPLVSFALLLYGWLRYLRALVVSEIQNN